MIVYHCICCGAKHTEESSRNASFDVECSKCFDLCDGDYEHCKVNPKPKKEEGWKPKKTGR